MTAAPTLDLTQRAERRRHRCVGTPPPYTHTNTHTHIMRTSAGKLLDVRTDATSLTIGDEVFEKGAQVIVTSELTQEEFYCTLSTLGATQIGLTLNDGSRARLSLSLLAQRRCSVQAQPPPSEEGSAA